MIVNEFGRPVNTEELAVTSTSNTTNTQFPGGKYIVLTCEPGGDINYRISYDPIVHGNFEDFTKVWAGVLGTIPNPDDSSSTYTFDTEGAVLRAGGPWVERGTAGNVTLNKTSAQFSGRDCIFSLASAATRLTTTFELPAAQALDLRFNHLDSDAGKTIDYAVTELTAAGALNYLQGGGAWTTTVVWTNIPFQAATTQVSRTFTSDEKAMYTLWFRATPADVGAYTSKLDRIFIAETAVAGDALHAGGSLIHMMRSHGRVSAYAAAGTPSLFVSSLEKWEQWQ